jgi:hypothetical protein
LRQTEVFGAAGEFHRAAALGCQQDDLRPTDDRPWRDVAMNARNNQRRIECGPAAPDRDALAADYQRAHKLGGVPPGSILRLRR